MTHRRLSWLTRSAAIQPADFSIAMHADQTPSAFPSSAISRFRFSFCHPRPPDLPIPLARASVFPFAGETIKSLSPMAIATNVESRPQTERPVVPLSLSLFPSSLYFPICVNIYAYAYAGSFFFLLVSGIYSGAFTAFTARARARGTSDRDVLTATTRTRRISPEPCKLRRRAIARGLGVLHENYAHRAEIAPRVTIAKSRRRLDIATAIFPSPHRLGM